MANMSGKKMLVAWILQMLFVHKYKFSDEEEECLQLTTAKNGFCMVVGRVELASTA